MTTLFELKVLVYGGLFAIFTMIGVGSYALLDVGSHVDKCIVEEMLK